MAKGNNQKLKLLYLAKIFSEETDEEHGLSVSQLISKLSAYDINVERKTLYADFEELRNFGMDIISQQEGKSYTYHLVSRDFELAELKLLVDSVQSSKFISEKKTKALIKKLEGLASHYDANQLQRQVLISGRVKSMNESTYYAVDDIHNAINNNHQIKFQYFNWNMEKQEELRHNGAWYHVSPWHLRWDDEYYYLIGYNSETNDIRHYRVDKMKNISITDSPRDGQELLKNFNAAAYTKKLFGMYSGDETQVTIKGNKEMAGIIIDRFGKDIPMHRTDADHFEAHVEVAISPQFLGWIISLSPGLKVTGPDYVIEKMQEFIRTLNSIYLP